VVLFARNVETVDALSRLVGELKELAGPPWIAVDQEGGPVDRLRGLFGPAVSLRRAALAGEARLAGELAGEACERFGIDVDLAPVVDRSLAERGERVLGERSAGSDANEVALAAEQFLKGLHARGVGGCLKHFPGLGRAARDTHVELPRVPEDAREEELDLLPFRQLMEEAGAVMVSHAAGADGRPASLSPSRATGLLRGILGFRGAAFSDDLEMGALSAFGGLPERSAAAARAGCDLLFVCRELSSLPACVEAVEREVPSERRAEASRRLDAYGRRLEALRAATPRAMRPLEALMADIRELTRRGSRAAQETREA
jgi:beta-N-acetylhexosaminidase